MAATILNSPRATEVSVYVVRAFVRLCEMLASNKDLAAKLEELEQKTGALALRHDTLAANTRAQLQQAFESTRQVRSGLRHGELKETKAFAGDHHVSAFAGFPTIAEESGRPKSTPPSQFVNLLPMKDGAATLQ